MPDGGVQTVDTAQILLERLLRAGETDDGVGGVSEFFIIVRRFLSAEQFAEQDKKQKETVETKNQSEGMIFEIEKQLKELGDKVTEPEKAAVEAAKTELQNAVDAGNVEDMKAKMEALTNAFYPISTRIYQEAQAAQQGAAGAQGQGFNPNMGGFNPGNMGGNAAPNDGTVDADYEVVDE